jgi:GT2 family glycosyltransferase
VQRLPNPVVSVIVVNYNCLPTLNACISTILRSKNVKELFLVDNGSTDGSLDIIKQISDNRLKIIILNRNIGLAAARNLAADKTSCDIIAITDADIAVDPQWLDYPCSLLKYHKEFGAVQCNLVLIKDINKIAMHLKSKESPFRDFSKEKPNSFYESLFPVGAAFVIKKDVWTKVGGFDSSFFIGNDDVDFGIRLWLSGFKVIVSCEGTVYHKFGTLRSQKTISPIFQFYAFRNMLIIWLKNLEGKTILKHVMPFIALYPIMAIRYGRVIGAKGLISFIKNFPSVITKRYEIQNLRRLSDNKIVPMLRQNGALPIEMLTNDFRLILNYLFRRRK